jgi:hypothetical protein
MLGMRVEMRFSFFFRSSIRLFRFATLDWKKVERKEYDMPWKPVLKSTTVRFFRRAGLLLLLNSIVG